MILKKTDKMEHNAATFTVASDPAEFEKAVQNAYLKNKKSIYIPGFRKGKAPRQIVEGMYGKEVFYEEAFDALAPDAFDVGLKESELRIVGRPAISDVQVTDDSAVEFTFSVTTYPEVTLGQYKGLEAYRPAVSVTDEDVDAEIQSVQKRNARMINVERPAEMGDTVDIDFKGFLDGEPFEGGEAEGHSLELGSNSFVPGFEEQLVGMSAGEEKDIDITFPEDYSSEELAGKATVFHVKVNEVSAPELPELDDEFAMDVSEFDTFEEYKADVRAQQEKRATDAADSTYREGLLRQACENLTAEIPPVMIAEKVEEMLRNYAAQFGINDSEMTVPQLMQMFGMNQQYVDTSIRPGAEMQVKTELLLDAVAKAENIEITDEDFDEYCEKLAGDMGTVAEDLKKYFPEEYLKDELLKRKALDLIAEAGIPTDVEPVPEESAEEAAEQAVPADDAEAQAEGGESAEETEA